MSFVIAISGVPGSGKSTLVKKMREAFGNAVSLHFDDYGGTSVFPQDFHEWVASGADPNEWQTPLMVADLQKLRGGSAITHPRSGAVIEPTPVILLEEPFGRTRQEMKPSIDFAAHLQVPLDIVLVRLVRRMLTDNDTCAEEKRQECSQIIGDLFRTYIEEGMRGLMQHADRQATESADIILDGLESVDDVASKLIEAVKIQIARLPITEGFQVCP